MTPTSLLLLGDSNGLPGVLASKVNNDALEASKPFSETRLAAAFERTSTDHPVEAKVIQ